MRLVKSGANLAMKNCRFASNTVGPEKKGYDIVKIVKEDRVEMGLVD